MRGGDIMPKGTNQKLKLYYLGQIMLEHTDEEHYLTLLQIQDYLEEMEVTADRRTLYEDLNELKHLGITVEGEKDGRSYRYHVIEKQFELAELKILVDSIQSSKFITERKSNALIKKLMKCTSKYEAKQLHRQVIVQGRIKSMNETIYYTVDQIHAAINSNKCVRFEYYQWNTKKQLEKKNPCIREVSPWALTWDDENYYLIGCDATTLEERHYRVDKMKNLQIMDKNRVGMKIFDSMDIASFSKMSFGMWGGERTKVAVEFKNELVGVFIDRFGKDIPIFSGENEGWSKTFVDVAVSQQFYGWIYALGTDVKITGPSNVVEEWKAKLKEMNRFYK